MMARPISVTQADMARGLRALKDAGLEASEMIIEPTKVRMLLGAPRPAGNLEPIIKGPKLWTPD